MKAYVKYKDWQEWCYNGGDFDCDYFNNDMPVTVLGICPSQPFGGETLYEITQDWYGARAFIPIRFLSLEFYDNIIGT